ncbi:DUF4362 domain-containing protein [Paucisalibacillus sp. EB02]|uniref:DUF4362 domain-containing protein n=1 Tax=Paucisalibacillus sp. EB02 TaxID=1347087 RepID=UPI0018CC0B7E|nr:DUF4362 domain-containing protein [Paucisalibacillus sp. EB02]
MNQDSNREDSTTEDVETLTEEYIPKETDVVFKNNAMRNIDILEDFIETAGANGKDNESQIRIVKYEPEGALIFDLQSRYDENANQAWIDVQPDLDYFDESAVISQDVFYNAPQQCWYMSKDIEQGFYKFHECRTNWEYHLFPIVDRTLTYEELINPSQENEKLEIAPFQFYDLHDIAIEIFLSKKDAQEWQRHFDADNQEKMEEVTDNNIIKLMQNDVNIAKVTDNKVLVTSCEGGLCEIYTEHSFQIRGFVVPEIKIDKESVVARPKEQSRSEVKTDSESFWSDIKVHVESLLEESSELITIYENDVTGISNDNAKLFYDKVNGRTNILRHLLPEDEEIVEEYYQILMVAELLFNSVHQGKYYFENGEEKKLEVLLEEEIIPLREELADLMSMIKELS